MLRQAEEQRQQEPLRSEDDEAEIERRRRERKKPAKKYHKFYRQFQKSGALMFLFIQDFLARIDAIQSSDIFAKCWISQAVHICGMFKQTCTAP
jgi:hypothetical protein